MTRRHHLARLGTAGAAALLLALAGCSSDDAGTDATPSPSASTTAPAAETTDAAEPTAEATTDQPFVLGLPEGITETPTDTAGGAGWSQESPGDLWVVTYGSSTNPWIASAATADGQTVTITLTEAYPGEAATMDYVPSYSLVAAPGGVDPQSVVTLVLGELGTTEITSPTTPGWVAAGS